MTEIKSSGQPDLAKEISKQPSSQVVVLVLLDAFSQIYSDIWEQNEVELKKMKMLKFDIRNQL